MDTKPKVSAERKSLRVDYFPHRIRAAGAKVRIDNSIAPRNVAVVFDVARIEVLEPEVVSEEVIQA